MNHPWMIRCMSCSWMIKRRGTPQLTSKPHWLLCCQQGCRDGAVVAHPTSNQGDAGSIPTHGVRFPQICFFIQKGSVSSSLSLFVHSNYIYIYIYSLQFAQIQPRIFTRVPALGYHERTYHEECTCHKTFYYADAFRRAASSGHKGYTQLSHYSLSYLYFPKLVSFVNVHVTQLIA